MTYRIESDSLGKSVHVKDYTKHVGGFPNGGYLSVYPRTGKQHYSNVKGWTGAMKEKHGSKMPIKSHMRGDPAPTKSELAQKRINNAYAAKGSSLRVVVNKKGKARVVTKQKEKKIMEQKKFGNANIQRDRTTGSKRPPANYGKLRNQKVSTDWSKT